MRHNKLLCFGSFTVSCDIKAALVELNLFDHQLVQVCPNVMFYHFPALSLPDSAATEDAARIKQIKLVGHNMEYFSPEYTLLGIDLLYTFFGFH